MPSIELETIEVQCFADAYGAVADPLRRELGIVVERVGPALCLAYPGCSPPAMFHRVLGLGVAEPATLASLTESLAFMDSLGLPYSVPVGPPSRPPELAAWLEQRGFTRGYAWMKFSRGVEPYPARTDLEIVEVGAERADAFASVVLAGFGIADVMGALLRALPGRAGWSCFVGFDGDRAVSAGALFVRGDVGELGFAATLPEARGRGGQAAILSARIRKAAELGVRTLVVETGERLPGRPDRSYRNILRAGFREEYLRDNWMSPVAPVHT